MTDYVIYDLYPQHHFYLQIHFFKFSSLYCLLLTFEYSDRSSRNKTELSIENKEDFEKDSKELTEDNPHVIEIRKKACITLRHLANLYQGNLAIVENEILIEALKTIMCQHHQLGVREEAAKTINTLCKNVLRK